MKRYVITVEQYEEITYKCKLSEGFIPDFKCLMKTRKNF